MVIAVHSIEGRSVAGPYNDAFSDAFDGEVGTTPPPSMPIEWPHAPSWWQNPERPVGLLLDPTGHAVAELPIVSASPKVEVSAVGECSLTLNLLPDPTLDSLLRVWEGSVVFTLGGKPFFGGYVARRRSSLGRTVLEVQVREWSGWLGRVWSNSDLAADEYDGDPINIGTLAWNRLQTAVKIIPPGIKFPPPLAGITHVNDATLSTVDELLFHNQDLPEANSPQSFLDEFDQMKEIGLDWTFPWEKRQDGTMWPTFRTANYVDDAPLVTEITLGSDTVSAEILIDTERQANRVVILGDDAFLRGEATAQDDYPPLWSITSYDKIGTLDGDNGTTEAEARVANIASSLIKAVGKPWATVESVELPSLRTDIRPGDEVMLAMPTDVDPRFPQGFALALRVQSVEWDWSDDSMTTTLELTAPWESLPDNSTPGGPVGGSGTRPPLEQETLLKALRRLASRVTALSAKR